MQARIDDELEGATRLATEHSVGAHEEQGGGPGQARPRSEQALAPSDHAPVVVRLSSD